MDGWIQSSLMSALFVTLIAQVLYNESNVGMADMAVGELRIVSSWICVLLSRS